MSKSKKYIPSGKTFEIRTIEDLFNVVTKENLPYLLVDLVNVMSVCVQFKQEHPEHVDINPIAFKWVDDGKTDLLPIELLKPDNIVPGTSIDPWIEYDFYKMETRPKKSGKYFVHRKDGKVHWEQWNGSGWAYNNNVITHYREILPPKIKN